MMDKRFQENFAIDILREMPDHKKQVLCRALDRNEILTSVRIMESGVVRVYKEGWYLTLIGTRCAFRVWAGIRLLYEASLHFNSSDFKDF